MKIFTNYSEKKDSLLNFEWRILGSGFCHLGKSNWTIAHRCLLRGIAVHGKEEEFVIRWQMALEKEPRYSWITLEFINPFEARWFYIWIKVWKDMSVKFVFNLGWRLTRASRDALERQAMELERSRFHAVREQTEKLKLSGGNINAGIIR